MPALREVVQVVHADSREVRHFIIRENLLARFDRNHDLGPLFSPPSCPCPLDAYRILGAAIYKSNSSSVGRPENESASTSRLNLHESPIFRSFGRRQRASTPRIKFIQL